MIKGGLLSNTHEIYLAEFEEGGWIIFFYGYYKKLIFQMTVYLRSTDQEDAVEEVYDYFDAETTDERHEVLSKMSILLKGDDDEVLSSSFGDGGIPDNISGMPDRILGEVGAGEEGTKSDEDRGSPVSNPLPGIPEETSIAGSELSGLPEEATPIDPDNNSK